MSHPMHRWSRVAAFVAAAAAVQAVLVWALLTSPTFGDPHEVPVDVVAPEVVAGPLTSRINALDGTPFVATPQTSAATAEERVLNRDTVFALVVDLRGTRDELLIDADQDADLRAAVVARAREVEKSYGRTFTITPLSRDGSHGPPRADVLTLLVSVAGFGVVLGRTLLFGPPRRTVRSSLTRVAALVLAAVVVAGALTVVPGALPEGDRLAAAVVLALGLVGAGLIVMALEAFAGLVGLLVATVVTLVLATPLVTGTDAYLLPDLWGAWGEWTHVGALHDGVRTIVTGHGIGTAVRPIVVVAAWGVVTFVVLLAATRLRSRQEPQAAPAGGHPHLGRWRLRVAAVVLPLVAVLAVAVSLLPAPDPSVAALPTLASRTECITTGEVDTVADLNRLVRTIRGGDYFRGGDVGADVVLQDGRRLWLFADTLRGGGDRPSSLVRNSMLVLGPDCIQAVVPEAGGAVIPNRPRSEGDSSSPVGYWPMSLARLERPGYDLVAVLAQRVRATGDGPFDFENPGPSIAVFIVPRGGTPQLISQQDVGPDDPAKSRPMWGAAAVVVDDDGLHQHDPSDTSGREWVYLYGTATPGDPGVFGHSLRVARVRPEELRTPSRWRYWNGDSWVADPSEATELIPAVDGVSETLSVFEQNGTWYALTKQNEFIGTNLVVWTAPAPTGPFTLQPPLAQLPSNAVTGRLAYMPLAHPDLLPRKGTVVVSYSRNSTDFEAVLENPLSYRPRFLRVKLP